MHVSSFVLFVIFQAATLLVAYAVYLYASRDKIRKSNDYLKFHFKESIQFQKKLMAELYELKNKQKSIINEYVSFIDLTIKETESRQNELFKNHRIHLTNDSPMDLQAIALRYIFLKAEKKVLEAHAKGNQLWEILEQSYMDIFKNFNSLENELVTISTLSDNDEDSSFIYVEDDNLDIEELIKEKERKESFIHNQSIHNNNPTQEVHKLRQINEAQEQNIEALNIQLDTLNDSRVLSENTTIPQEDKIKQLQNTIAKSRVIIKALGEQLKNSNAIIKNMQSALTGDKYKEAEFNKQVIQFVTDSQDMLMCIETLEKDKDLFMQQLKQANIK